MVDVDYANKCPAPTIEVKDEADPTLILTLDPKKGADNVRDMAQHLVDHVCVICTQQFQTTEDLKKHFWDHDENIGQVGCLFCKVAFPTKDDLVDHIMGGCLTYNPEPNTATANTAALLGTSLLFQALQSITFLTLMLLITTFHYLPYLPPFRTLAKAIKVNARNFFASPRFVFAGATSVLARTRTKDTKNFCGTKRYVFTSNISMQSSITLKAVLL